MNIIKKLFNKSKDNQDEAEKPILCSYKKTLYSKEDKKR